MVKATTNLIALIGKPAKHSLSPQIQNYFLEEHKINAAYMAFEVGKKDLKNAFYGAKSLNFVGLNITMPYKEKVIDYVDFLDEPSTLIKAVNTISFQGGISYGYNTDHEGFIRSLQDKEFVFKNASCLVIGAGGVAKSTIYALIRQKAKKIFLYNRTKKNALKTADIFTALAIDPIIVIDDLNELDKEIKNIGLVVNCSSLGMLAKETKDVLALPKKWDLKEKYVFEMVYNPVKTPLINKAIKEGAIVINGIDMLISQAAFSFQKWFDIYPDTSQINKTIVNSINKNII